jgi:two-component system CheB/CheR fusion protein
MAKRISRPATKSVTPKAKPKRLASKLVNADAEPNSSDGAALKSTPRTFTGSAIVAIGASAGGYEATSALLEQVKANGMSFVIIQHTDAKQEHQLVSLLSRSTALPITLGTDGTDLEPDHVYLIPSHEAFGVLGNQLVRSGALPERKYLPIDAFFRSLAEDVGSKAIGVILSGTGSDGTIGLAAIKETGGITFAQNETAKFDGMPRSAIQAGVVDYVMSPLEIAQELGRIGRHPYLGIAGELASNQLFKNSEDLNRIFLALRPTSGIDFSNYKDSTVKRRIYRRMLLLKIGTLSEYARVLQERPEEVKTLGNDLLINVTSFFRDPDSFEALKENVLPEILRYHNPELPIRIWTAGCSTGEEAYSLAITVAEFLGDRLSQFTVQIFATDASEDGIGRARRGVFLDNIAQDVSVERLRKFFRKTEGGYQVSKTIRDMCIFAKQNIVKDPPFSRLDLISCRNVLIYLGPSYQKLLIGTFHQALTDHGFLMLGTSETIGNSAELFHLVDKKNKIYRKKSARVLQVPMHTTHWPVTQTEVQSRSHHLKPIEIRTAQDLQREADRIVLSHYGPAGVIVDEDMQILHFRGQTGAFLEPAAGAASLNLLRMLREGLRSEVRTAVASVRKTGKPVRREHIPLKRNGSIDDVSVEVTTIPGGTSKEIFFLVLFHRTEDRQESTSKKKTTDAKDVPELGRKIKALEQELADTKEYLQRNIEEQDAYTEELKSANEEIQSSNEELQSTNEELETAKEELQSINEELTTLNDELQMRNSELTQANNDLSNLLANTNFGVVMVGMDLRIRRFNPMAEKIMNVIPSDIGRSIRDIKSNLDIPDLGELIVTVIDTLVPVDRDVPDIRDKRPLLVSVRPYKTNENRIDGAVIIVQARDVFKGKK